MQVSRREARGLHSFTGPLVGIVLLLACYVLLVEWQDLPRILNVAISAVHWPV